MTFKVNRCEGPRGTEGEREGDERVSGWTTLGGKLPRFTSGSTNEPGQGLLCLIALARCTSSGEAMLPGVPTAVYALFVQVKNRCAQQTTARRPR